jgi:hypothetical protein
MNYKISISFFLQIQNDPLFLCLEIMYIRFFITRFVIESTKAKIRTSIKLLQRFCVHRTEGTQKIFQVLALRSTCIRQDKL